MKVMILAAGYGKRLLPLTKETPKPLLKVGDKTLIQHNIEHLIKNDFTEFVINISHLGHMIENHVKEKFSNINIEFSKEDKPLGTGGGILNAIDLLGDENFLVMNSDIFHKIDIKNLPKEIDAAHLIGVPNPSHNQEGDFCIKDNNKVYFNKLIERFKKIKFFDLDRVIFLDPLSRDNYINHLGTSSVLLDPLYFGAGNSFHESMVYGTPTITMPTKFIKSRIVSAAYIQMEIENPPVVNNKKEYVELAIDLANKENLLEIKKYYQKRAIEKLFNTTKAGEEFNQILIGLD